MTAESEEKFEVETPLGPLWFWGRDTGLPVVVLITGAFAEFDVLDGLSGALDGVDIWRSHLPGNHSPALAATSVGAYAAAFSHALKTRLADRPVVVLGLSVGALVALGVRAPNVQRLVLVEPPVLTAGLWMLRLIDEQAPPGNEAFLWNILGIGPNGYEPRDYTGMVRELTTPALVMIGEEPVGVERPFTLQPSMITDAAREALAANPNIEIVMAAGAGHNVPRMALELFFKVVLWTCRQAFGPQVGVRPAPADA